MDYYQYLLKFVTSRPRSVKEIEDWLIRKRIGGKERTTWLEKLKEFGFIDDDAFAKWWVEQRLIFKPKGRKALAFELRQKGVSKDIIQSVLATMPINEEKNASDLVIKNLYKWKGKNMKLKAQAFLARKGFSWEVIDHVTSKVVK